MAAKKSKRHVGSIYYAIAIMDHLERMGQGAVCLVTDVVENVRSNLVVPLLTSDKLMDEALDLLSDAGLIESDKDDYGPPIITLLRELDHKRSGPFSEAELATVRRYTKAGQNQRAWLLRALEKLNQNFALIEEQESDMAESDNVISASDETDWEPLPLDRKDPRLLDVIQKMDELTEAVRGDNGYAATFGEEKKFVLDKLQAASKALKEQASISWMYIREFAINPIVILSKRFGAAAIGIAAEAAKTAIKEWLKKKGLNFLDGL